MSGASDVSDDLGDPSFRSLMDENYCIPSNTEDANLFSKISRESKRSLKDTVSMEMNNTYKRKAKRSALEVYSGAIVYLPDKYDSKTEEDRLMDIITKESDLVWADVRNLFVLQVKEPILWPGRILTDYEINLLDMSDRNPRYIHCKEFTFVELFGYRKCNCYYPDLIQSNFIYPFCGDILVDDVMETSRFFQNTRHTSISRVVLYDEWKEGMRLFQRIIQEKNLNQFQLGEIERFEFNEKEHSVESAKRKSCRKDYRKLLKENTIRYENEEKKEDLCAGDLIGYYYKPFGVVGSPTAYFETHILSIYRDHNQLRLKLENGHVLVEDTQVKRLKRVSGDVQNSQESTSNVSTAACESNEAETVYRCLRDYNLVPGNITNISDYSLYTIDDLFRDVKEIKMHHNDKVLELGIPEKDTYRNTIFSTKNNLSE